MKETMKVIEAIGQLKIQEDRIAKAMQDLDAITANRITAKKVKGLAPDDYAKNAKSAYDSVSQLIRRYLAMKEAVNEFNAGTKIVVACQEMSVASALYLKGYGLEQKKTLLYNLQKQLIAAKKKMDAENGDKLDEAAERHAKQNFEGDVKADKLRYLEFIEEYKDHNQFVLIDPINIEDKIKKLSDEIAAFEAGVDTAIQIANATHDITIEY